VKVCDGSCIRLCDLVDRDVIDRVKSALEFGQRKKYLAVAIDIADIEALLKAVGGAP
jgi:hypothetical protein